jgi:hypothetical protein
VLNNNKNNLSVRIIKLKIIAKFEDWEGMREEIVEAIDIYNNIMIHCEDETRRIKMAAELNTLAEICGGPEILFENPSNIVHFSDRVVNAKKLEIQAPFTKENFINRPNVDTMLEVALVNIKKRSKRDLPVVSVEPRSIRSMKNVIHVAVNKKGKGDGVEVKEAEVVNKVWNPDDVKNRSFNIVTKTED